MVFLNRNALIATVLAVVVAGCSTPKPAPVEHRTAPPAAAKSAPPPRTQNPPTRNGSSTADKPAVPVTAAPIASGGMQSRPLSSATVRMPSSENLRTEPRGEKLAYSDEAVAELRRAAPAPAPATPASPPAAPVATAPASSRQPAPAAASAFDWPASGPVIKAFSEPSNMGISIAGKPGDPVSAVADGKVIFSGVGPKGYGNLVIVRHDSETLSVYAHNRKLLVKDGDPVKRGQRIAELGDSGTDRPKLHFEIRKAGKPVDPQKLLPRR